MKKRVLVIGGYGNFGRYITQRLSSDPALQVIVAGRSEEKCRAIAHEYNAEYCVMDINKDFPAALARGAPDIVIHTSGPFQGQGYAVAEACIAAGCHYIDLADGRDFVAGIPVLDRKAKDRGVCVISGASSVPCLTSAVVDHYLPSFQSLERIDCGIATSRANTGLATTAAILGYVGKPFKALSGGDMQDVYGWQGMTARKYPEIGWRLLGYCDIPDLDLFPARYRDLQTQRFSAGMEMPLLHVGLWGLSWLVRVGLLRSLEPCAEFMLKAARILDPVSSGKSAFHLEMVGRGIEGHPYKKTFYLIAREGDGPLIPCIPSILCAGMLARGEIAEAGARPCMGIISLPQYMNGLSGLNIESRED